MTHVEREVHGPHLRQRRRNGLEPGPERRDRGVARAARRLLLAPMKARMYAALVRDDGDRPTGMGQRRGAARQQLRLLLHRQGAIQIT